MCFPSFFSNKSERYWKALCEFISIVLQYYFNPILSGERVKAKICAVPPLVLHPVSIFD